MPRIRSTIIRVFVTSYGKDRPLMMRYRDPATGKRIAMSSGTYSQKEAEREAAKWEQDINAQRWTPGVKMSWDLFCGQQKANEDETVPVTREFGERLLATPASERVGRVAPLPGRLGNIGMVHASEQICAIGEAAKIVVEPRTGKFASSHDIRRLFVTSLLRRFSPAVVQKLARHESIETTMSYYADLSGEVTADLIWNDERATGQATE